METEATHQHKEEDELPRRTINCMKRAMQELLDEKITPLEDKINLLLETKRKQEQQEEEISTLKNNQKRTVQKMFKNGKRKQQT